MIFSILRVEALVGVDIENITYTGAYALVWSFVEPAVGISVASAPFLRPIFRRVFPGTDLEMGQRPLRFFRVLSSSTDSLPSFVDSTVHAAEGRGKHGSLTISQHSEPEHWTQSSLSD
jgi:hypothetical protein